MFVCYFLVVFVAFLLRPGTDLRPTISEKNVTDDGNVTLVKETVIDPCYLMKLYRTEDIVRLTWNGTDIHFLILYLSQQAEILSERVHTFEVECHILYYVL